MTLDERSNGIDARRADAAYRSFPSFEDWLQKTIVDNVRWDRYSRLLQKRNELTPELLAKAREVAKRAAAVDTGAIEGLYPEDRGFTFAVALQIAQYEALLDAKGPRVRSLIESQMSAYDFALDFATQRTPMAEAWIRTLHEVMCQGQETYTVHTGVGIQEHQLPLGQYKFLPNHVIKTDGVVHSYCPVDLVPAEMQRLCSALRSSAFLSAHPVQQATYAHYALVVIHPFADGNGRVARALASVYTYRALSVPIVILAEHRAEYFSSLAAADAGIYQSFVQFMLQRTLNSIQLVSDTIQAAGAPSPQEAAAELRRMYVTQGGYTQAQVDDAGYRLFQAFQNAAEREAQRWNTSELWIQIRPDINIPLIHNAIPDGYRRPLHGGAAAEIALHTSPPTPVDLTRRVILVVPKDSMQEDDLVLRCLETFETLESRITESLSTVTGTLTLRLSVFVQGLLGRAIEEIARAAKQAVPKGKD
jgi:Fic family protein